MSDSEEDFTRVFIWVLSSLVLFTIVVMLLARSVGLDENSGPMTDKDIDARTMPYGTVKIAGQPEATPAEVTPAAANEPATAEPAATLPADEPMASTAATETAPAEMAAAIDGQALFSACAACHSTGAAGAPVVGNAAAWAPRAAVGIDALVASAINGKGAMPPRGGRMDFSDAQIRAIIEYMLNASK